MTPLPSWGDPAKVRGCGQTAAVGGPSTPDTHGAPVASNRASYHLSATETIHARIPHADQRAASGLLQRRRSQELVRLEAPLPAQFLPPRVRLCRMTPSRRINIAVLIVV